MSENEENKRLLGEIEKNKRLLGKIKCLLLEILNEYKDEKQRWENEKKHLENDKQRLENDKQGLENEKQRLENDKQRWENEKKHLEKIISDLTNANESIKSQWEEKSKEFNNEIRDIQEKKERAVDELKKTHSREIKERERTYQDNLSSIQKKHEDELKEKQKTIDELMAPTYPEIFSKHPSFMTLKKGLERRLEKGNQSAYRMRELLTLLNGYRDHAMNSLFQLLLIEFSKVLYDSLQDDRKNPSECWDEMSQWRGLIQDTILHGIKNVNYSIDLPLIGESIDTDRMKASEDTTTVSEVLCWGIYLGGQMNYRSIVK